MQSDGAYVTYTPTGGADPVSKKLGSIYFSKSVSASSNTSSVTFSIASDYSDYANLTLNTSLFVYMYSGQNIAKSDIPSGDGIPSVRYSYTASTGKITATIDNTGIFYTGRTYYFRIFIV